MLEVGDISRAVGIGLLLSLTLAVTAMAQDDIADVKFRTLTIEDQPRMAVELIGEPAEGRPAPESFGLVLVLPGGDGGEGFSHFVRRIHKFAMPEGYLTARLTAVKWTDDQEIVWPTAMSNVEAAQFTTEQYIAAAVARVAQDRAIDPKRVFVLAWSSSGPAAYAASLTEDSPVTGSLIAMSVFRTDWLPPLGRAEGHAYYLLQSPQDAVTPYQFARGAAVNLRKHGAHVELVDYDGGHGWHGDVFGMIRDGVTWLEANAGRPVAKSSREAANLLDNGGFEAGLDGWIVGSNSGRMQLDLDATTKAEGDRSLRLTKTGGMPLDLVRINLDDPTPGAVVTVSAQVKAKDAKNTWIKFFAWNDAGDDLIQDVDIATVRGTHDWKQVGRRYTLPPGTSRAAVQCWMVLDGTVWLDDVRIDVDDRE